MYDGFAIEGVEVDKLAYFAASVFWRGTLPWRGIGNHVPSQLDLGSHADELRLFLLGEQGFPEHVALGTFVSSVSSPPIRQVRCPTFDSPGYWLEVPGLTFLMLVGSEQTRSIARDFCTARTGRILVSVDVDSWNVQAGFETFLSGRKGRAGKLRRLFEA
jgi:hypothetical protein